MSVHTATGVAVPGTSVLHTVVAAALHILGAGHHSAAVAAADGPLGEVAVVGGRAGEVTHTPVGDIAHHTAAVPGVGTVGIPGAAGAGIRGQAWEVGRTAGRIAGLGIQAVPVGHSPQGW
jgi:hypothetical protein